MKSVAATLTLIVLCGGTLLRAEESRSRAESSTVKKTVYKKTPQGELAIHLHFPPGWKKTDKRAAIVFFFGGGWRGGKVTQFQSQAEYLAMRGMVTARADYRVKGRHKTTADKCVEDCKSAVRWLRKNAANLGIDPNRIAAGGGSAGGHTAAATATTTGFEAEGEDHDVSSKPNLLVLFNPALNTSRFGDRFGSAKLAKQASPNDNLSKGVPPAIIFFGTNDFLLDSGKEYVTKAKKIGLNSELHLADGQKHGFFNRSPWKERTMFLTDQFLVKYGYLKGKPTITPPANAPMTLSVITGSGDSN